MSTSAQSERAVPGSRGAIDRCVQQVASRVSAAIGEGFFRSVVEHLAGVLKADCVYIGEFQGGHVERVKTLAAYLDRRPASFEYELAGSAAAQATLGKAFICRAQAQKRFPTDSMLAKWNAQAHVGIPLMNSGGFALGVLVSVYRKTIRDPAVPKAILEMFASRVAAEMERRQEEELLRQSEQRYRAFVSLNANAMWRIEFDQPISIALLLDASASMTYAMRSASKAAMTFVDRTLKPGDRCTVFAVRDTPRREIALTSDRDAIEKAILSMRAAGRTSLYDAISSAIREMRDEKYRRAIVVLTDGGDNTSMMTFDEIDGMAKESGIPIYFIAYDSGEPTELQDINRMTYLAGETGGFLVTAEESNLGAKYGDIERDLRAQYAILYKIVDYAKHNQWRRVRVVMNSPRLTARTINGYFAP